MTKNRKKTEAEQIFCCFCDGYFRHVKMAKINFTAKDAEDLHEDAKAYVKLVLKTKKEYEEQDDD